MDADMTTTESDAQVLTALKEELVLAEGFLKSLKGQSSSAAVAQSVQLMQRVTDLKNDINRYKPIKVRVKGLRGAVKWRKDVAQSA
jgi:hypothetical protein